MENCSIRNSFFQPSPFWVAGERWNTEMRPTDGQYIDRWLLETGWIDAMSETNDEDVDAPRSRKPWTGIERAPNDLWQMAITVAEHVARTESIPIP